MEELSAEGKPAAQKITAGTVLGFPLRRYGLGLAWNYTYFQNKTPADLAAQVQAATPADRRRIEKEIKVALFGDLNTPGARGSGNYQFHDSLAKGFHLSVKKLLNADGAPIPPGPNGEIFDGTTHTHYMVGTKYWPTSNAVAALLAGGVSGGTITGTGSGSQASVAQINSDLSFLTKNVREHWIEGQVVIYINASNETDIRSAPSFVPLTFQSTITAITVDRAEGALEENNINNRRIGNFLGAAVWVKPWIPADYLLCFYKDGAEKVLVARTPIAFNPGKSPSDGFSNGATPGDLRIVQESGDHPLYAMAIERQIGFGAWNRQGAAVMFVGNYAAAGSAPGNSATAYTPPSL